MAQPLSEFEAEHRPRWDGYLQRCFPGHADAIARGWQLVDLLSDRGTEPTNDTIRRFTGEQVAVIGDSLHGVRFRSHEGDFTSGRVYFRAAIYPGDPPPAPPCVHYEVCVLGSVAALLWPFNLAALVVPAEHYIIRQTF